MGDGWTQLGEGENEHFEWALHWKGWVNQRLIAFWGNTVVGHVSSPEEPAAKAEGCWGGDTLANLGFTNIQAGGAPRDVNHESRNQEVSFAEAEWKVQGVHGTNPFKIKKKVRTTSRPSDTKHLTVVKVDEKPAFVKKCMKNLNSAVTLKHASSKSAQTKNKKSKDDRQTLDRWKLYQNTLMLNQQKTLFLIYQFS